MRMQEFKEGKIAVYAETKDEAYRFLAACEKERLRWCAGQKATEFNPGENVEIVYGFRGVSGLSWAAHDRSWHAQHPDPDRPYKSVTVAEFFGDRAAVTDLSFEAFKRSKYAVTFKNPKRGDPEVEAFLKVCEAKSLSTGCMAVDGNIRPGIKTNGRVLYGAHGQTTDLVPYASVPWAQSQKRERVTIYRTADGRVECVHTQEGKEVGKASVTRYYKDTDDFLTAAKYAIDKLPAAEKSLPPFDKDGNLLWRVGQKVQMRKGWLWPKPFVGEIVDVRSGTHAPGEDMSGYDVREPDGVSFWQRTADIISLAE